MENGYFTHKILVDLVYYLGALLLLVLANLAALRRMSRYPAPADQPFVSVLVPARNEEGNIAACLRSLLEQEYPAFEVLVLDDSSTDATRAEIGRLQAEFPALRLLEGRPLPEGWLGKPWACALLAAEARGELLLFTDADTRHRPAMLRQASAALQAERADFLTAIPREEVRTWGEKLVVPVIPWSFFAYLPLWLAGVLPLPGLVTAIGQLVLVRRPAYDATGGHAAVRAEIAEDVALARRFKAAGFRWRIVDAADLISCRMYRSFGEAFAGLSRSLLAVFDHRIFIFSFVWGWTCLAFLAPPVLLLAYLLGAPLQPDVPAYALADIGLSLLVWGLPFARLRLPAWLALFYPAIVAVSAVMAARSVWLSARGSGEWKGRRLGRVRWKVP